MASGDERASVEFKQVTFGKAGRGKFPRPMRRVAQNHGPPLLESAVSLLLASLMLSQVRMSSQP